MPKRTKIIKTGRQTGVTKTNSTTERTVEGSLSVHSFEQYNHTSHMRTTNFCMHLYEHFASLVLSVIMDKWKVFNISFFLNEYKFLKYNRIQ